MKPQFSWEWPLLEFDPINLWSAPNMVYTECQKRCQRDDSGTYCIGCGRTMKQIEQKGKKKNG